MRYLPIQAADPQLFNTAKTQQVNDLSETLKQRLHHKFPHLEIERRDRFLFDIKMDILIQVSSLNGLYFDFMILPRQQDRWGLCQPIETLSPETKEVLSYLSFHAHNLSYQASNEWLVASQILYAVNTLKQKSLLSAPKIYEPDSCGGVWKIIDGDLTIEWQIGEGFKIKNQVYPDVSLLRNYLNSLRN